jgi:hypothetical protein
MASAVSPCEKTFSSLPRCNIVLPSVIVSKRSARYGSATALEGCDLGALVAFTAFLALVRLFTSVSTSKSESQLCAIVHRLTLCLGATLCPGVNQKERGTTNVVDHQFDLNRVVGVGNVVVLHDGRVYSYPARNRDRNRVVAVDQRPQCSLTL